MKGSSFGLVESWLFPGPLATLSRSAGACQKTWRLSASRVWYSNAVAQGRTLLGQLKETDIQGATQVPDPLPRYARADRLARIVAVQGCTRRRNSSRLIFNSNCPSLTNLRPHATGCCMVLPGVFVGRARRIVSRVSPQAWLPVAPTASPMAIGICSWP